MNHIRSVIFPKFSDGFGLLLVGLAVFSSPLGAEVMTLTDKEGRSIKADVMSLDGDVLNIKREDGMFFELSLNKLSTEDQKKVSEWAAKEAALEASLPLPRHALDVTVSRTKFDSQKSSRKVAYIVTYTNGSTRTEYKTHVTVNEQWGYGITLTNRLLKPVDGQRIEYRIYSKGGGVPSVMRQGTLPVEKLKARDRQNFKTQGIPMSYEYIQGETSPKSPGGNIYGIWLRIYRGDILDKEYSTPESLSSEVPWSNSAAQRR